MLPKDHTILERGFLEFRPFGVDPAGEKIRDVAGMTVRANVDYLEECMDRAGGPGAGGRAVEELCRLLNERIRDRAYHVSPQFLKNIWNSYSYEFTIFLAEFCERLSGDPDFQVSVGRKFISPLIQTLGRPFSVSQIYRMFAHFGDKFVKGSVSYGVDAVTDRTAVLRMKFADHVYRQFWPYRKACAELVCQCVKAALSSVPEQVHHLQAATVKDLACIAEGAEYCQWEFAWTPPKPRRFLGPVAGTVGWATAFGYLRVRHPAISPLEQAIAALVPAAALQLASTRYQLSRASRAREDLVQEQLRRVETLHEELREAYLDQERTTVSLRRKVAQLTTLHQTGLSFNSTLSREALIQTVLQAIVQDLHYDRAMIAFYDPERRISHDARVLGVSDEVAALARSLEVPIVDPDSLEGTVLLKGEPILVGDLREVLDRVHPFNHQLAAAVKAKALISVPLKVKERILGALTVDRIAEHSFGQEDVDLIVTVANQVAIALDNTTAYLQIEELIAGLEAKVRQRTAQLEQLNREMAAANEQLTQMDLLKSQFLSHVSHELRTPLTSIKGFTENMLGGLAGALTDKQQTYLTRVIANTHRLIRMITELLDQSRIEAGKIELVPTEVNLDRCIADAVEQLRPEALAKRQRLDGHDAGTILTAWADEDRLIQIVTNLVHNAVKFTPEGGAITVQVSREGPQVARVSVRDTGPGIAPDALPKIFDPFFRAGEERRTKSQGLGLGLSIVKTLVELHGGNTTVRSEPGRGTEFSFTVPLRPAGQPVGAVPGSDGKRILVVDDDPDIRQLLLDRLAADGYCAETTADGARALEALGTRSFDGMMLDIGMPDLDGLDVLRRIRATHPSLPVIMVTASGAKERAIQAVSLGAQAYLLKPFDAEQLQEVVARWFGTAAAPDRAGAG